MEERGRLSSGVETSAILLRLPTALLARLDAYKAAVERETRFVLTRMTLLQHIVAAGLDALEQRPPAMPPAAAGHTPAPTDVPQAPGRPPPPARRPRTASKPARKPPKR